MMITAAMKATPTQSARRPGVIGSPPVSPQVRFALELGPLLGLVVALGHRLLEDATGLLRVFFVDPDVARPGGEELRRVEAARAFENALDSRTRSAGPAASRLRPGYSAKPTLTSLPPPSPAAATVLVAIVAAARRARARGEWAPRFCRRRAHSTAELGVGDLQVGAGGSPSRQAASASARETIT